MKVRTEVKIGFIAIITLFALIWGINFLKGKNLFSSDQYFFVEFDNIGGLEAASPVFMQGYQVGFVESIKISKQKTNKLIVRFSVKKEIKLPVGSQAAIFSSDLLGTKALDLKFSDATEFHQQLDTLTGYVQNDIISELTETLMPLKTKAESVLTSMDSVLNILNGDSKSNIKNTLQNLENASSDIDKMLSPQGKINKILANVESISSNLKNNNEQITTILENFSSISDSLAKAEITSTINNADATLKQLNEITQKIAHGEGSIGLLVNDDSLYVNLNNAAADLDSLLIDLKENPGRYVHVSVFGKKEK